MLLRSMNTARSSGSPEFLSQQEITFISEAPAGSALAPKLVPRPLAINTTLVSFRDKSFLLICGCAYVGWHASGQGSHTWA